MKELIYSQEDLREVGAMYYGKLEDVVKLITLREFKQMATLEILNNMYDKNVLINL